MRVLKTILIASLVTVSTSLFAQPTTTQAGQKPYEPSVGQAGKDVVWVPTPQVLVEKMLDIAKLTPKDFLMDLGSGDGRTVITAAKRGSRAQGIEFNPDMVALSQRAAEAAGVSKLATFTKADLFETDFSKADVVTMFLLPSINMRLRPTILNMRPGTRIVTNTFTMEDWEADESATVDNCQSWCTAYLWIVPAKVEGAWTLGNGTLNITQKFQNITGTIGSDTIANGKLHGSDVTFNVGNVKYTGRVSDKSMTGTMSGGRTGSWTAARK